MLLCFFKGCMQPIEDDVDPDELHDDYPPGTWAVADYKRGAVSRSERIFHSKACLQAWAAAGCPEWADKEQ